MKLFFTLSNIELQDNGYDIAIADKFSNCFNIAIKDNLRIENNTNKTKLKHIKDNSYEIICYVYNIFNKIAFVEVSGLKFMIDIKSDTKVL